MKQYDNIIMLCLRNVKKKGRAAMRIWIILLSDGSERTAYARSRPVLLHYQKNRFRQVMGGLRPDAEISLKVFRKLFSMKVEN